MQEAGRDRAASSGLRSAIGKRIRDRLVQLAGPGQRLGELDAGGFRAPIAIGGLPEGIQPLLVVSPRDRSIRPA